jgi:hypothetical protein
LELPGATQAAWAGCHAGPSLDVGVKAQLSSDRMSCHSATANQVRLVLHTAAFWQTALSCTPAGRITYVLIRRVWRTTPTASSKATQG